MADEHASWIGRETTADDTIAPGPARALWASLEAGDDEPLAGQPLPPLWHWLYFWELTPRARLGPDGHAALGGFLPPLGQVRRMWAGSRVAFHRPLVIGATASRRTTIADITAKQGRSGALTFVMLRHEIADRDGIAITEEQDLVYRDPGTGPAKAGEPAPDGGDRIERWTADPVLLFRYSALTFNSHRIHYDAPYAKGQEGYPGLVVHGPLLATLMAGAAQRHRAGAALTRFSFRAASPVFAGEPISIHVAGDNGGARVWVRNSEGGLAASGRVEWKT
jgi:3-methylfumaryl-CoA hydratase